MSTEFERKFFKYISLQIFFNIFLLLSSIGWQHHPPVTEDCQEDSARGGLEKNPGGPKGHGRSALAA